VNPNQTLDAFMQALGIDVDANFAQRRVVRAATTRSQVSRQDRIVERHAIGVRAGAFWQVLDSPTGAATSILADPFSADAAGTAVIFSLPNGLFGFALANANRTLVDESDVLFDPLQNDFVARTAVSCSRCHAQGILPVLDEVREFVAVNPQSFDPNDVETIRALYPTQPEFQRIVSDDSSRYLESLARAGVPESTEDPVSEVFLRFDDDLAVAQIAGALGVSQALLLNSLAGLDPVLRGLETSTIDRDDFDALYLESLCNLQSASQNQPDPDLCEAGRVAF
jgi:hypothetical protein